MRKNCGECDRMSCTPPSARVHSAIEPSEYLNQRQRRVQWSVGRFFVDVCGKLGVSYWIKVVYELRYRVTHQVVLKVLLTSKSRLHILNPDSDPVISKILTPTEVLRFRS